MTKSKKLISAVLGLALVVGCETQKTTPGSGTIDFRQDIVGADGSHFLMNGSYTGPMSLPLNADTLRKQVNPTTQPSLSN